MQKVSIIFESGFIYNEGVKLRRERDRNEKNY